MSLFGGSSLIGGSLPSAFVKQRHRHTGSMALSSATCACMHRGFVSRLDADCFLNFPNIHNMINKCCHPGLLTSWSGMLSCKPYGAAEIWVLLAHRTWSIVATVKTIIAFVHPIPDRQGNCHPGQRGDGQRLLWEGEGAAEQPQPSQPHFPGFGCW